MMSFTKADLEAIALLKPVTANNNTLNMDALIAKAHYERSVFLRNMIAGAFAKMAAGYKAYRADQKAILQLLALTDHELADMGIVRGGIKQAVLGEKAVKASFVQKLVQAIKSLPGKYQNRLKTQAGYQQLMAMDARQLSDIGLTRGDIAAAVTGKAALANDNASHAANNNGGRQVS